MAYKIAAQGTVGFQPISEISTTKKHTLGTEVDIVDLTTGFGYGRAMYVAYPASGAIAAGILLTFATPDGTLGTNSFVMGVLTVATHRLLGAPVYVNLTAVSSVASVQYGWVLVIGIAPTLKTASKPISTSPVLLADTAGRVQIALATVDRKIAGARYVQSSVTTTTSLVNIFYNRAAISGAVS